MDYMHGLISERERERERARDRQADRRQTMATISDLEKLTPGIFFKNMVSCRCHAVAVPWQTAGVVPVEGQR
jgi:hypothetical protein